MTSTRRGPFATRRLSTRHLVFAYRLWNSSINQEASDRFRVGASWSHACEAEGNQISDGCRHSLLRSEQRRHPDLCRYLDGNRNPTESPPLKDVLMSCSSESCFGRAQDDVWTL
uniref:Pellino n=1 Tax=Rhipicephalus zambeziensis TaxID=60191 RepID=A0A224Z5T8_9ACAR